LPFEDGEFDTIILDDVLADAGEPLAALRESRRLLKGGGRLLFLSSVNGTGLDRLKDSFASWAGQAGLRLAPPRPVPETNPGWLLGVATV
jgi:ubiquinone/menaquinone biosynthesis C-methylase UbiE